LGVTSVALAASATSATGYTPYVDGVQYATNSTQYTIPTLPHDDAQTYMWSYSDGNGVPAGWMGVDARSFKNGSLCVQTGYQFNPGTYYSWYSRTSTGCGSGTYYSYGVIAAWNGSGYNYYYSQQSPSLNG
jgi:hypothetical protein